MSGIGQALLLDEREEVTRDNKPVTRCYYTLADGIDPSAIDLAKCPEKSVSTRNAYEESDQSHGASSPVTDKAGHFAPSMDDLHAAASSPAGESATSATEATGPPYYTCRLCPAGLWHHESQQRGICASCWKSVNPNQESATA